MDERVANAGALARPLRGSQPPSSGVHRPGRGGTARGPSICHLYDPADSTLGTFLRRILILLAAFGLQSASAAESGVSRYDDFSQSAATEWLTVGGGWNNARYSSLTQINTRSVKHLGVIWVSDKFHDGSTSFVTPVVKGSVMFLTAGQRVYALEAKTGKTLWSYKTAPDTQTNDVTPTEQRSTASLRVPNSRGVAIGQDLIFVGLMDGHVIALQQRTGEPVWIQQIGIDEPKKWQMASPAPTYINGVVLTGLSNGDANLRGQISALDAATGKELWRLYSVPGPGEAGHETWPSFNDTWKFGGGGVWTNAAVDAELGVAYFATGNPVPAFAGDWRPGDNLYTCSVLAVDIKTGEIKWYYQLVHHDVFEADAGTPIILYDAKFAERTHKALAVLRSDGYLFQLDRQTGRPLLPVEERSVPQLQSQQTSPTQPFPVGGESILMSCEDWKKEKIPAGFVLGCMWTPPASPPPSSDPQNILAPFPSVRVSPMAFSPQTGYFYAQGTSFLTWPRRSQDPYHLTFDTTVLNLKIYGEFSAIDRRTGKIVWRKQIHTKGHLPIYLRGGPIVTAGGLTFRGSGDGNVEAYDARTGEVLWRFQTGVVDGPGSPASYEIDGEQYLAVPMGPTVWAFKLGGRIPAAAPPPISPQHAEEFSGPIVDTVEIETISFKRQLFGSGTRYFIDEFAFNPSRARVTMGSKVMIVNNGSMRHEIVASDGSWGTGSLSPTQEAWITFDKPGHYTYICKDHPWTYGQIIVAPGVPSQVKKTLNEDNAQSSSGSFAVQAARGKEQFKKNCSTCHGEGLSGQAMVPTLSGTAFASRWRNTTVGSLFDKIRLTMPQATPGSLDNQTYLDIVAYLLQANDLVSRKSELEDSPEELRKLALEKIESTVPN